MTEKIKDQIVDETLKFVDTITNLRDKMVEMPDTRVKTWCTKCKHETEHQLIFDSKDQIKPTMLPMASQCLSCSTKISLRK